MKLLRVAAALLLSTSLAGCFTTGASLEETCDAKPFVCYAVGAMAVGGVVLAAAALSNSEPAPKPVPSDMRLKHDIRPLRTLDSGVKLYTFAYNGSDAIFIGAMAQDLLADPRFAHAVRTDANGYLAVDYAALGLGLFGAEQMQAAGAQALLLASGRG